MWEVNDIQALILGMMGRCYYRAVETVSGDHGCFTEQCTTGDATQSKSSIHPSYQIKIRITQITVVRDSCSNGYGSVLYFVAEWDSMVYDVMPHHDTETETNQSPPYCHNKEETHVSYNMHIYIYISFHHLIRCHTYLSIDPFQPCTPISTNFHIKRPPSPQFIQQLITSPPSGSLDAGAIKLGAPIAEVWHTFALQIHRICVKPKW